MNRRQLSFIIIVNALVSLAIVLLVTWIVELRRPDPEELAAIYTPPPPVIVAATPTPPGVQTLPTVTGADSGGAEPVVVTAAPGDEVVYIVQVGDSLLGIASRYDVTVETLVAANNLANPDFVFSGQRIVIPVSPGAAATVEASAAGRANEATGPQIVAVENAGNLAQEAVLLVNESDAPVNLRNWRVERAGGPAYTFGGVQLFAGSSVRVYSTSGQDNTIALYWSQPAPVWTPGATVRLVDTQGTITQSFTVP